MELECGRAAIVLAIALAAGCGGKGADPGASQAAPAAPVAGATPTVASGCLPPGETAATSRGPFGVGRRTVTFVDPSRPTAAVPGRGIPARPDRTLDVVVIYPTASTSAAESGVTDTAATAVVDDAPPVRQSFPLVVLSHGVTANGAGIAALATPWVRAGYVVAAPTYPLSSGEGADIADLVNQPADLRFVITSLTNWANEPTGPLHGSVAPGCLALAGHSLGAATSLDVGYLSSERDGRVRAVVEMSGVLAPINGGTFDDAPGVPLLLLHGDADTVVPISKSQEVFATLPGPRHFVTFEGASHVTIFAPPAGTLLNQATTGFLDAYLKGDVAGLRALPGEVAASGAASLRVADATLG